MARVHMNKVVAEAIAKPKWRGNTLYTRVDECIETSDGSVITVDADVVKSMRKRYNSPDNVRKLFVHCEGVVVQYFRPVYGSPDKSLWRKYKFTGENVDLGDLSQRKQMFRDGMTAIDIDRFNKQNNADIPTIIGSGLRAIYKPWVYQNVEEIYFDWLPFTAYRGSDMQLISINELFDRANMKNIAYYQNQMIRLLGIDGCTDINQLNDRYPRLHTIGYIEDLSTMVDSDEKLSKKGANDDLPWYFPGGGDNKDKLPMIVGNRHMVVRFNRGQNIWKEKYSAKPGIYIFDRDILSTYFEKITDSARAERLGKKELKEEAKELQTARAGAVTQIEARMLEVIDVAGEGAAAAVMHTMVMNKDIKWADLVNSLSSDFKKNHSQVFDIVKNLGKGV